MQFNNTDRFQRCDLPWQEIEGRILILSPERQKAHDLNRSAGHIWKILSETKSLEDIVIQMNDIYGVGTKQLTTDVCRCLDSMGREGLVARG